MRGESIATLFRHESFCFRNLNCLFEAKIWQFEDEKKEVNEASLQSVFIVAYDYQ
jgi:hypothetical protein